MTRKSVVIVIGIVVLFNGFVAAAIFLLFHEPEFYHRCALPQGRERQQESGKFISEFGQLVEKIHDENPNWSAHFDEKCINSYFEESFVPSGVAERVLPEGIDQPRIAIDPDKIRVGFRYGTGLWSTVVSIDLRVWLAAKERNVVALELQALHAGSLPVSAQSLLERVSDVARSQNIEVTWWRHNGNPVALLRFQADRPRPTIQLKKLELHQGWVAIEGSSTDNSTVSALFPMTATKPWTNQ